MSTELKLFADVVHRLQPQRAEEDVQRLYSIVPQRCPSLQKALLHSTRRICASNLYARDPSEIGSLHDVLGPIKQSYNLAFVDYGWHSSTEFTPSLGELPCDGTVAHAIVTFAEAGVADG